jgi:hypothetical protein
MATALWWGAHAALALVALPLLLLEAGRIIRALRVVTAATRDIAGSAEAISGAVPAVTASLSGVAGRCRQLEAATVPSYR